MLNNLLFYRIIILNSLGLVALFASYQMGFVQTLIQHDSIGAVYGISALLGIGVIGSLIRGWLISQKANAFNANKGIDIVDVRKMIWNNEFLMYMAGWAVLIGLFGNVWGLLEALSKGSDFLTQGAGVAFGSTAAGILAALWLEVNYLMIRTTTGCLLEDVSRGSSD